MSDLQTTTTTDPSVVTDTAAPEASPSVTPAPSSESSGEFDTRSIVESVIREQEEAEQPDRVQSVAPEPQTQQKPAAEKAEEDDLDTIQADYTDSLGRKRENRIPYTRVQKIVENKVKKAKAEWESTARQSFGVPVDQPFDLNQIASQTREYHQTLQSVAAVEQIMENDPEQFLTRYVQSNPKAREVLASIVTHYAAREGVNTPNARTTSGPAPANKPQPDIRLSDGSMTYSREGLESLLAFERQQAVLEAEERIMEQVAPFTQTAQEWQRMQQMQAVQQQATQRINEILTDARSNWPGFKDNEEEIAKVVTSDPNISLEAAYRKVVFGKLTADRNKVREDVLKELNSQPRSVTAPAGNTRSTTTSGPRSTRDIAAEILSSFNKN